MKQIARTGFISGLLATIFTLAYVIVQTLQVLGLLQYPLDEILVYSTSLGITLPLLITMLVIHYHVKSPLSFWSLLAVCLTLIYLIFVTANYVVQLATVLPMKLEGKSMQVALLDQTPHSMFWNFDAMGYIFLGLASLSLVPVFPGKGPARRLRYSLLAHALITPLIMVVYFYPDYSFTILRLGYVWGVTAPLFMFLLALQCRQFGNPMQPAT